MAKHFCSNCMMWKNEERIEYNKKEDDGYAIRCKDCGYILI